MMPSVKSPLIVRTSFTSSILYRSSALSKVCVSVFAASSRLVKEVPPEGPSGALRIVKVCVSSVALYSDERPHPTIANRSVKHVAKIILLFIT